MRGRTSRWLLVALVFSLVLVGADARAIELTTVDSLLDPAAQTGVEFGPAPVADAELLRQYLAPAVVHGHPKANQSGLSRAQVVNLYNTLYVPGNSAVMGWTGSGTPSCTRGATNATFRQSVLDRFNFFRQVAGLPVITFFTPADTIGMNAQDSALMQGSNDWNVSPHSPPPTWTCYTSGGATAAGKSNLGKGLSGPDAIIGYMDDFGVGNEVVGHRRWILYPPLAKSFSGDIENNAGFPYSWPIRTSGNDLWVIPNGSDGTWGSRPTMPDGVAWPPGGFVPYQALPSSSNRWSFSFPGANMSAANVTITKGGLPVNILGYDTRDDLGYGDASVAFRPNNIAANGTAVSYLSPGAIDQSYIVTVSNMTGAGVPATVTYTVTVIDPAVAPNPIISGTITNGGGVQGVTFCTRPPTGFPCSASDPSGAYSCTVPSGWTGTLHSPIVSGNRIPAQVFSTPVTSAVTRNVTAKTHSSFACNLDIDNNGLLEPAFDGVAILRRMADFNESSMAGLAGSCAPVSTTTTTMFAAANPVNFHATNGTQALAETDGLILLRVMQGLSGGPVTAGLIGQPGATRNAWGNGFNDNQIRQWLNATCGTDF